MQRPLAAAVGGNLVPATARGVHLKAGLRRRYGTGKCLFTKYFKFSGSRRGRYVAEIIAEISVFLNAQITRCLFAYLTNAQITRCLFAYLTNAQITRCLFAYLTNAQITRYWGGGGGGGSNEK